MTDVTQKKSPAVKSKLPTRVPTNSTPSKLPPTSIAPIVSSSSVISPSLSLAKASHTKKEFISRSTTRVSKLPPPPPPASSNITEVMKDKIDKINTTPTPTQEINEEKKIVITQSPSQHSSSEEESVHLAKYDDALTPLETPKEKAEFHNNNNNNNKRNIGENNKNQEKEEKNSQRELNYNKSSNNNEEEKSENKEKIVSSQNNSVNSIEYYGDLAQQLVKAEERVGELTEEVTKLRNTLYNTENPLFVQHTFEVEKELERFKKELLREKLSTKYHREAHMSALMEVGKLREEINRYGIHESLLKRNKELEAKIDDMVREKIEQDLHMAKLKEETSILGNLYGGSSFGSGYITVRLAGLCENCRDKLKLEADRREFRNYISQILEEKPMGIIPPSLSNSWSPEIIQKLKEPREQLSSNFLNNTTSSIRGINFQDGKKDQEIKFGDNFKNTVTYTVNNNNNNTKGVSRMKNEENNEKSSNIWRQLRSPDGRIIYYNIITNTSTFDCPTVLAG